MRADNAIEISQDLTPDLPVDVEGRVDLCLTHEHERSQARATAAPRFTAPRFTTVWRDPDDDARDGPWVRQYYSNIVPISGAMTSTKHADLVVMTSTRQRRPSPRHGEAWITACQKAGPPKPSAIKHASAAVEKRLIARQLGRLQPSDEGPLRRAISARMAQEMLCHAQ